jgi:hypothetical protein
MSDLEQTNPHGAGVKLRARSRPHGETDADAHEGRSRLTPTSWPARRRAC